MTKDKLLNLLVDFVFAIGTKIYQYRPNNKKKHLKFNIIKIVPKANSLKSTIFQIKKKE